MGLAHVKGSIALGLDADLTLVDMKASWQVERSKVQSSAGYSIYEGQTFKGRVNDVFVRGRAVILDGAPQPGTVGTGRYVPRKLI
jgi:dihydroorotase-like cyclic amidohydrolase